MPARNLLIDQEDERQKAKRSLLPVVPQTLPTRKRTAIDVVRDIQEYDSMQRQYDNYGREARNDLAANHSIGSLLGMMLSAGVNSRGGTLPAMQAMMPGLQGMQSVATMNDQLDERATAERQKNTQLMASGMMADFKADRASEEKALDRDSREKVAAINAQGRNKATKIMEYVGQDGKKRTVLSDGTVVMGTETVRDPGDRSADRADARDKNSRKATSMKEIDRIKEKAAKLYQYRTKLMDTGIADAAAQEEVVNDPQFKHLTKSGRKDLLKAVDAAIEEHYKSMNEWQRYGEFDITPSGITGKTYDGKDDKRPAGRKGFSGKRGGGI